MIKRIMFVCHGNICRSPMAEIVLRDLLEREGLDIAVASSATSTEEIYRGIGNPIYPPARRELLGAGYSVPEHRATLLLPSDYDSYDLFVGMDGRNIANMRRIFGSDPEGKVRRLLEFCGLDEDVADPWYTGDFATTLRDIKHGCASLLEYVKKS